MCFSVEVETNLEKIAKRFNAKVNQKAFDYFGDLEKEDPKKYKYAANSEDRVYSKYWAPVVCMVRGEMQIRPMRYQLLPSFCETEKYTRINPKTGRQQEIKNTFNARLDSLTKAKAWEIPFMKYHAIIAAKRFYEWVEKDGQKKLVSFHIDDDYHIMPCLYDTWYSNDKSKIIQSFAIITTDPAKEVEIIGHDRTPVNLRLEDVSQWLSPEKLNTEQAIKILKNTKNVSYQHEWI